MKPVTVAALLSLNLIVACADSAPDQLSGVAPGSGVPSEGCSFVGPGNLIPGSGRGVADRRVWAEGITSPLQSTYAVAKSQVYSPGGSASPLSDECAAVNFAWPHRDTFCETRSSDRDSYNCPTRRIHQGIDINAGTVDQCRQLRSAQQAIRRGASASIANIIPVHAVTDGLIAYIGSYTVDLIPDEGPIDRYRYLHMNMQALPVEFGEPVRRGQIIGYYYNDFGGNSTTFHLHFEVNAFIDGRSQYVSPYMSFIAAERRAKSISCVEVAADG